MAIYHCSIKIISRGKGGIVHTEILLPPHAPPDFLDRSTLWNSVEKIEKAKNSQLAREIEIALPIKLDIWMRVMNDYGHIDNTTPSLAMSVFKEYRGFGIGTALLKELISILKTKGYSRISLSVQKDNYAVKVYQKVGFTILKEVDDEYIMVIAL